MKHFVVLGCNHTTASAEEIGRARVPADQVGTVLHQVRERVGFQEVVYVATCHRTEWYLAYEGEMCPGRLTMAIAPALAALTGGASLFPPVEHCVALDGEKAARHLFRVTAALDSLMIGETQVLGQVKDAFRSASEGGLVGPLLTTLFTQAFRASKRVRTETSLSRRPVSLVSLAKHRIKARLEQDALPVAVLGAGEMAAKAVELVRELDAGRSVVIFNRGISRGAELAAKSGAAFLPFHAFADAEARYGVVIAATGAQRPVVTPAIAARLAPSMLLDLGLPANVAPECAAVPGIEVVDQKALRSEADANRSARAGDITKAEEIVEEQLQELAYETMEHELSPVARKLIDSFRAQARIELERMAAGNGNGEHLEEAIERLSQRLVRIPMRGLREVAWHHSTDVLDTFLQAVEG